MIQAEARPAYNTPEDWAKFAAQIAEKDTPVHVRTILEMNDDELEGLTTVLRGRRLQARKLYQESIDAAAQVQFEKDKKNLLKHCEMLQKEIDRSGKLLEALDKRIANIRVLRLTLEGQLPELEDIDGRK